MRELDSTTRASAGDVSSTTINKRRPFATGGPSFNSASGLVDVFAEVFARIASSTPTPAPTAPATEPSGESNDQVSPSASSDNDPSAQDDRVDENDSDTDPEPLLQIVAPEPVAVAVETNDPRNDPAADPTAGIDEQAESDAQAQEILIAPAPVTVVATTDQADAEVDLTSTLTDVHRGDQDADAVDAVVSTEASADGGEPTIANTDGDSVEDGIDASRGNIPVADAASRDGEPQSGRRDRRRERGSDQPGGAVANPSSAPGQSSQQESAPTNGFAIPLANGAESPSSEPVTAELQQKVEAALNVTAAVAAKTTAAATAARASQGGDAIGGIRGASSTSASTPTSASASTSPSIGIDPSAGSRVETAARLDQPKSSDGNRETQQADLLNRIKLVQRVSKAFQHLGPEGGLVRLRLAPAELGTVRIEMRMQQKKIEARVVADTEAAGAALREHLPDLRARLEALGMQVEKIDVDVEPFQLGDDGGSRSQTGFGDASSKQQSPERLTGPFTGNRGRVSRSEPVVVPQTNQWSTASGGVDVRI